MLFTPTDPKDRDRTQAEWEAFQLSIDQQTEDFVTLILSKKELRLLRQSANRSIEVTEKNISHVESLDFANLVYRYTAKDINGKDADFIKIRKRGSYYLKYIHRETQISIISSFRYWVTTAIAVLALIVSIIALVTGLSFA